MSKNWQGKAVSIQCVESLGVFQGTIKEANSTKITIIRAFRNGLPLRTLDTEITIMLVFLRFSNFSNFFFKRDTELTCFRKQGHRYHQTGADTGAEQ